MKSYFTFCFALSLSPASIPSFFCFNSFLKFIPSFSTRHQGSSGTYHGCTVISISIFRRLFVLRHTGSSVTIGFVRSYIGEGGKEIAIDLTPASSPKKYIAFFFAFFNFFAKYHYNTYSQESLLTDCRRDIPIHKFRIHFNDTKCSARFFQRKRRKAKKSTL